MLRYILSGHKYAKCMIILLKGPKQLIELNRKIDITYNQLRCVLFQLVKEGFLELEQSKSGYGGKFKLTELGKEAAIKLAELFQIIERSETNDKTNRSETSKNRPKRTKKQI